MQLAAARAGGFLALTSHRAGAGRSRCCPVPRPDRVELTLPIEPARTTSPGVIIHRTRRPMSRSRDDRCRGIPVTQCASARSSIAVHVVPPLVVERRPRTPVRRGKATERSLILVRRRSWRSGRSRCGGAAARCWPGVASGARSASAFEVDLLDVLRRYGLPMRPAPALRAAAGRHEGIARPGVRRPRRWPSPARATSSTDTPAREWDRNVSNWLQELRLGVPAVWLRRPRRRPAYVANRVRRALPRSVIDFSAVSREIDRRTRE